jgi:uncharacterized membrane protein YoaK (UPF0700 family)
MTTKTYAERGSVAAGGQKTGQPASVIAKSRPSRASERFEVAVLLLTLVAGVVIGVVADSFVVGFAVLAVACVVVLAGFALLGPSDSDSALERVRSRIRAAAH